MTPLTQEQSAYAAKHHDLVYAFLRRRGYSDHDYYDVVIFGYLAAVQSYFEREDLCAAYAFSTIAFKRMRSALNNHFTAERRLKRTAEIVPLNAALAGAGADIGKVVLLQAVRERLERRLTPRQKEILRLLSEGYCQAEIADMYHVTGSAIWGEIARARECIRIFTPEWRELIAA